MRDLAELTHDDFEVAVDTDFALVGGANEAVKIRLTQVSPLSGRPGARPPFSLLFRGPPAPILEHITHHLIHAEIGELELFLGPIASDSDGVTYEAVIA